LQEIKKGKETIEISERHRTSFSAKASGGANGGCAALAKATI